MKHAATIEALYSFGRREFIENTAGEEQFASGYLLLTTEPDLEMGGAAYRIGNSSHAQLHAAVTTKLLAPARYEFVWRSDATACEKHMERLRDGNMMPRGIADRGAPSSFDPE